MIMRQIKGMIKKQRQWCIVPSTPRTRALLTGFNCPSPRRFPRFHGAVNATVLVAQFESPDPTTYCMATSTLLKQHRRIKHESLRLGKGTMNTSQQQWQPSSKVISTIKPIFYNAVLMYNLDYPTLQALAEMAKVEQGVVDAMFTTVAVHRTDALKVLAAFSEYTGVTWTLDNVKVALLPTFADICEQHKLNIHELTLQLDRVEELPFCTFDMMLENTPVLLKDASIVLDFISTLTKEHYSLENVDIPLLVEGVTQ
jgi:hypothetical protein